jgi:hypothetical protein
VSGPNGVQRRRDTMLVLMLLAVPGSAFAGGDAFKVEITDFVRVGSDGASFRVVVKDGASIPTATDDGVRHMCKDLRVQARFRPEARFDSWTVLRNKDIGRKEQLQALIALETAAASKAPVAFGYIGSGLHVLDKEQPCHVESRWLEVELDNPIPDTSVCVLSYYKRP